MPKEGVIKFNCTWKKSPPLPDSEIKEINSWRQKLYDAGLIGKKDGPGYGNISCRIMGNLFIITGSQTEGLRNLDGKHYTKIVSYDYARNKVVCEGPTKPSSESLTHAAIYESDPKTNAVVHVHSPGMWKRLFGKIPTTSRKAAYGTPEMAYEMMRLFRETDIAEKRIAVMGGHRNGLISFGKSLKESVDIILREMKNER